MEFFVLLLWCVGSLAFGYFIVGPLVAALTDWLDGR